MMNLICFRDVQRFYLFWGMLPYPVGQIQPLLVKLLKEDDFDLIFCDLLMPVNDGMEDT
jgi:hypothetical protein